MSIPSFSPQSTTQSMPFASLFSLLKIDSQIETVRREPQVVTHGRRDPRLRLVVRDSTPSSTSLHCRVYEFGDGRKVVSRRNPHSGPTVMVIESEQPGEESMFSTNPFRTQSITQSSCCETGYTYEATVDRLACAFFEIYPPLTNQFLLKPQHTFRALASDDVIALEAEWSIVGAMGNGSSRVFFTDASDDLEELFIPLRGQGPRVLFISLVYKPVYKGGNHLVYVKAPFVTSKHMSSD
ncbi:hypothetical protein B0H13DRAFT_1876038 [Mycena leptocephala]|nr:hypothetical protein B0H13DRAFT_1876038 [Mycena leptocephala]